MNKTEQMLMQIVKLLAEIRDELRASNRIIKKESEQRIAESRTKQRQMRQQMMLVESRKRQS
jgi:hypothetical protein